MSGVRTKVTQASHCGEALMRVPTLLVFLLVAAPSAFAQDIVGIEDCAQARGPDKKIGCLQSNVGYLHGLIRKNDAAAQARLKEETAKLAAATARLDALAAEIERLKVRLDQLEKPATPKPASPK
jgi:hypothetical protein